MAERKETTAIRGLEGVIAAETRVGKVDGVNGKLFYAGFDIDDLAEHATFEEVVFLLWNDRLPSQPELEAFRKELVSAMRLPAPLVDWFKRIPEGLHPMVILRSAVSDLALFDPEPDDNSPEATRRKAVRLVGGIPAIIAGIHRFRQGLDLPGPDPEKGIGFNFLRMFNGADPDEYNAKTMDLILVLHADHGFNASTFSARVTASTLADIYGAVTAAIATLQGPLHGGANQRVMEMLTEIGDPADAEEYIEGLISKGQKIMGFGHRVYKVEDPRAKHLRKRAGQVCREDEGCYYFAMSQKIEEKTKKEKGIYPNVDFYSATVQNGLGIPAEFFTTVFAAARIAGWSAHVMEQLADNRLIRPKSEFIGKFPRPWVPISERN
jgi:citrate synthase